jgi:hypothetical protein
MKEVLTVILFVFYIFHFKSLIRGESSVTLSLNVICLYVRTLNIHTHRRYSGPQEEHCNGTTKLLGYVLVPENMMKLTSRLQQQQQQQQTELFINAAPELKAMVGTSKESTNRARTGRGTTGTQRALNSWPATTIVLQIAFAYLLLAACCLLLAACCLLLANRHRSLIAAGRWILCPLYS